MSVETIAVTDVRAREIWADFAKAEVLISLVEEGLLDAEAAEEWAGTHTIIIRKKNFFRTITDRWRKADEAEGEYLLVVKRFDMPKEPEGKEDEPRDMDQ